MAAAPDEPAAPASEGMATESVAVRARSARPPPRRLLLLAALGVLLALLLYYPVGAWRAHVIDDDIGFASAAPPAGQSHAVTVAAALIRREIDQHGWTPNKPFFMPAAILDDMPAYQKGILAAVGRFAIEMDEQVGRRAQGDSGGPEGDPDLGRAAGLLQYPPNVWMIDPAVPWATTVSTEKQYRNAARALEAYNQRLAAGQAAFFRRPEALAALLDRFAWDTDATAAGLDQAAGNGGGWFAGHIAGPFYGAKGRAYGTLLVLNALGDDFSNLLVERHLAADWHAMLAALQAAATPRPWVVLSGTADSTLVPNHPAVLGYHLSRAGSRMAALAKALRQ